MPIKQSPKAVRRGMSSSACFLASEFSLQKQSCVATVSGAHPFASDGIHSGDRRSHGNIAAENIVAKSHAIDEAAATNFTDISARHAALLNAQTERRARKDYFQDASAETFISRPFQAAEERRHQNPGNFAPLSTVFPPFNAVGHPMASGGHLPHSTFSERNFCSEGVSAFFGGSRHYYCHPSEMTEMYSNFHHSHSTGDINSIYPSATNFHSVTHFPEEAACWPYAEGDEKESYLGNSSHHCHFPNRLRSGDFASATRFPEPSTTSCLLHPTSSNQLHFLTNGNFVHGGPLEDAPLCKRHAAEANAVRRRAEKTGARRVVACSSSQSAFFFLACPNIAEQVWKFMPWWEAFPLRRVCRVFLCFIEWYRVRVAILPGTGKRAIFLPYTPSTWGKKRSLSRVEERSAAPHEQTLGRGNAFPVTQEDPQDDQFTPQAASNGPTLPNMQRCSRCKSWLEPPYWTCFHRRCRRGMGRRALDTDDSLLDDEKALEGEMDVESGRPEFSENASPGKPLSDEASCGTRSIAASSLASRSSFSLADTAPRGSRLFFGQLCREGTILWLQWFLFDVCGVPFDHVESIHNHRDRATLQGKGCAIVYFRVDTAFPRLLSFHHRSLLDAHVAEIDPKVAAFWGRPDDRDRSEPTISNLEEKWVEAFYRRSPSAHEGLWVAPQNAPDRLLLDEVEARKALKKHRSNRSARLSELPLLPRYPLVVEVPAKTSVSNGKRSRRRKRGSAASTLCSTSSVMSVGTPVESKPTAGCPFSTTPDVVSSPCPSAPLGDRGEASSPLQPPCLCRPSDDAAMWPLSACARRETFSPPRLEEHLAPRPDVSEKKSENTGKRGAEEFPPTQNEKVSIVIDLSSGKESHMAKNEGRKWQNDPYRFWN